MLLGAVGAYEWNGTVVMQKDGKTIIPKTNEFYDPKTETGNETRAGYLGECHTCLCVFCLSSYSVSGTKEVTSPTSVHLLGFKTEVKTNRGHCQTYCDPLLFF